MPVRRGRLVGGQVVVSCVNGCMRMLVAGNRNCCRQGLDEVVEDQRSVFVFEQVEVVGVDVRQRRDDLVRRAARRILGSAPGKLGGPPSACR